MVGAAVAGYRASKFMSRCGYGTTSGSNGFRSGLQKSCQAAVVRIESGGTGCSSECDGRFVQAWLVFKKQESHITACQQKR
ncbi:hypothetical protein D8674_012057 [Pyrus ussuriensis x Pyrus communis]|uniref:Uncharacterized protein n=1 Tax=Pyrus ussuriensis x Pyrus communis TaxID=2448454 RepID=A0A5N5G0F6_9ROSA|nr:hypothetical protein D8674_012057 [Pyrus ussuriensis x Pyrus communis]